MRKECKWKENKELVANIETKSRFTHMALKAKKKNTFIKQNIYSKNCDHIFLKTIEIFKNAKNNLIRIAIFTKNFSAKEITSSQFSDQL